MSLCLARRLKSCPGAKWHSYMIDDVSTAELSHQPQISPWPQEKRGIGLSLAGFSRGRKTIVASSEASRFLNVQFLALICSVIWVQNPHVSFPHKRVCDTSHTNRHTSRWKANQGKSWIPNCQCWWRQDWNAHPKSLLHQLKALSKCPCVSKLQLSPRAMLFSKCCEVKVMMVTPSLNWWPTWTTWCTSMWKSSAGSLCSAIGLMRQMESARQFILPSVPSRSVLGTLSAIIPFCLFRTRRARAFWLLRSNGTCWSYPGLCEPGYQPNAGRIRLSSWQHSFAWRKKYRCSGYGWRQYVLRPARLQPCPRTTSTFWPKQQHFCQYRQVSTWTWINIAAKCKAHTNRWDKSLFFSGNILWTAHTFLFLKPPYALSGG